MSDLNLDSLDGLRSALAAAEQSMLAAVQSAAPRWRHIILSPQVPERSAHERGDWSPRFATAHALMTQWLSTDMASEHARRVRAGQSPPDIDQFRAGWWQAHETDLQEMWGAFDEHARVPAVVETLWGRFAESLHDLRDEDLDLAWDAGAANLAYLRTFGLDFPAPTLHTLLTLNVIHLLDHAAQIADGMTLQWED